MLKAFRTLLGQTESRWVDFWRRVEGPELEPFFWHSHYLSHCVTRDALVRLGRRLSGTVIDVGAGTGHGETYLDPKAAQYYPTDLPSGRDAADRHISRKGKAPMHRCSVYDLPFPDHHFGGGMMLMVLEHLQHPQRGLQQFFRVIRPGGMALVSVPFAFPFHGVPNDYRRWTTAGIRSELEEAGFVVEACVPCGGVFSTLGLNWNLALRGNLLNDGPYVVRKLLALALPLLLPMQALVNLLALLMDRLDGTATLPLAIVLQLRRP